MHDQRVFRIGLLTRLIISRPFLTIGSLERQSFFQWAGQYLDVSDPGGQSGFAQWIFIINGAWRRKAVV
jgi:hypothetical protein